MTVTEVFLIKLSCRSVKTSRQVRPLQNLYLYRKLIRKQPFNFICIYILQKTYLDLKEILACNFHQEILETFEEK